MNTQIKSIFVLGVLLFILIVGFSPIVSATISNPTSSVNITGFLANDADDTTTGQLTALNFIGSSASATSTLAGGFAIETSGFVYDFSTNNVGIGTASPGESLEVVGNVKTDNIVFPATAVPNANVNTLDDYEEGTFTPIIVFTTGSGTIVYGGRAANYTKIGNVVFFQLDIATTDIASRTGTVGIGGLPFATHSSTFGAATVSFVSGFALTAGTSVTARTKRAFTQFDLEVFDTVGGTSLLQYTEWSDNGRIIMSGNYQI